MTTPELPNHREEIVAGSPLHLDNGINAAASSPYASRIRNNCSLDISLGKLDIFQIISDFNDACIEPFSQSVVDASQTAWVAQLASKDERNSLDVNNSNNINTLTENTAIQSVATPPSFRTSTPQKDLDVQVSEMLGFSRIGSSSIHVVTESPGGSRQRRAQSRAASRTSSRASSRTLCSPSLSSSSLFMKRNTSPSLHEINNSEMAVTAIDVCECNDSCNCAMMHVIAAAPGDITNATIDVSVGFETDASNASENNLSQLQSDKSQVRKSSVLSKMVGIIKMQGLKQEKRGKKKALSLRRSDIGSPTEFTHVAHMQPLQELSSN